MVKKVTRSARGEVVDFDSLKIKEQLASAPTPLDVKTRQNFIENRLKRRLKKKVPVIEKAAVNVEPTLPEPTIDIEQEIVEVDEGEKEVISKKSKQKARKRNKD